MKKGKKFVLLRWKTNRTWVLETLLPLCATNLKYVTRVHTIFLYHFTVASLCIRTFFLFFFPFSSCGPSTSTKWKSIYHYDKEISWQMKSFTSFWKILLEFFPLAMEGFPCKNWLSLESFFLFLFFSLFFFFFSVLKLIYLLNNDYYHIPIGLSKKKKGDLIYFTMKLHKERIRNEESWKTLNNLLFLSF